MSTEFQGLYLCVRVPKSGSASLMRGLEQAFGCQQIFYLPNTADLDGQVSRLQRLRFWRARFQNLFRHYRTFSMRAPFERINRDAAPGDLVMGGHIDFRTAQAAIARPLKIITLLREPVVRARSEYDYLRRKYLRKPRLNRFDASILHKAAGRYDFDSFLDFLSEHQSVYGDIACRYVGWDGQEDLAGFFTRYIFHSGVLERSDEFAHAIAEKLGRPFSLPHENRDTKERSPVTGAQRAKLERIYARDILLHEWARTHR
ncbi:MAG TPA: hypothetical protein VG274_00140 [Rhizomicrobium sp.]|nr:hypothetical protein [Rhizomicrobium sp.]